MKMVLKLLVVTLLVVNAYGQDSGKLYPISKGNLWGYIDKSGATIVNPQFYSAGQFSEGLASVRLTGTYGYIDKTGTFIIPPKYDLALPFEYGIAKVFIDGKPYFIDKKGNIRFEHNYKRIASFGSKSFAIAITQSGKYGIINRDGKIIVDTLYKEINPFIDGVAVVKGLNNLPDEIVVNLKHTPYTKNTINKGHYEVGVIDSLGNWVVQYGRYKKIDNFKNHYAKAELIQPTEVGQYWSNSDALIDDKGNQRFIFPRNKFRFDYGDEGYYNDVAVVKISPVKDDTGRIGSSNIRSDYIGVINPDGKTLFSDENWIELTPFAYNRAFALDKNRKWKLINKSGNQTADSMFNEVLLYDNYRGSPEDIFSDGVAFVKLTNGWVIIDTTGKILTEPKFFSKINYSNLIRVGKVIFFGEDISVESPKYPYRYGFWNTENNITVSPTYHYIDMNNFDDDLIYVMKEDRVGYITREGKQIWMEPEADNNTIDFNIDYMNRGYYYASSEYKKELAGFGHFGSSENPSKTVVSDISKAVNQLQIILDPYKLTTWSDHYKAMKMFVVNGSKDTMYFNAQDSWLNLKIQAQDKRGVWKDIEYLPSSWCGNSYHALFLASNEYWEFATPIYQGECKTKIRAQLRYKKIIEQENEDIIYSNEIDGYINPGQFWNKREYSPSGLMDPYND